MIAMSKKTFMAAIIVISILVVSMVFVGIYYFGSNETWQSPSPSSHPTFYGATPPPVTISLSQEQIGNRNVTRGASFSLESIITSSFQNRTGYIPWILGPILWLNGNQQNNPLASNAKIISPQNITYNNNSIQLIFNVTDLLGDHRLINYYHPQIEYNPGIEPVKNIAGYSIDEGTIYMVNITQYATAFWNGNVTIPGLQNGNHSVTVYNGYLNDQWYFVEYYSYVNFTIDTLPPIISNLSIGNQTYNQSVLPLSFNFNESTSWMGYSLDNKANATFLGNTTLENLTEGLHSLVIYANDTVGNMGKSDTVSFNVNTQPSSSPTQQPTPSRTPMHRSPLLNLTSFYIIVGTAALAIIIIIAGSAIVYFKRHKK